MKSASVQCKTQKNVLFKDIVMYPGGLIHIFYVRRAVKDVCLKSYTITFLQPAIETAPHNDYSRTEINIPTNRLHY